MTPERLTHLLKLRAGELGFGLVGACPAITPPGLDRFGQWIAAGYAGEMRYLADRAEAYAHPRHILDGAHSVLMLGRHYRTSQPRPVAAGQGRVSRYAWGTVDYHDTIHGCLKQLKDDLQQLVPGARARGVIDTAPLLEREFAQLAGLGWIGKNTMLINKRAGSWFFLAALITDQQLHYDQPHATDHCGTCRACLDACPTGAFPEPGVLDATRCLSYLTIELRGSIPAGLRGQVGEWLFGCDICQEVCPWNHRAPVVQESGFQPAAGMNPVELESLFRLSDQQFRQRFRHTPLWRAKRRGLLRNAAMVLGNQRPASAMRALATGLNDPESLVRQACAWALGRYGAAARDALQIRLGTEEDAAAVAEIRRALDEIARQP